MSLCCCSAMHFAADILALQRYWVPFLCAILNFSFVICFQYQFIFNKLGQYNSKQCQTKPIPLCYLSINLKVNRQQFCQDKCIPVSNILLTNEMSVLPYSMFPGYGHTSNATNSKQCLLWQIIQQTHTKRKPFQINNFKKLRKEKFLACFITMCPAISTYKSPKQATVCCKHYIHAVTV